MTTPIIPANSCDTDCCDPSARDASRPCYNCNGDYVGGTGCQDPVDPHPPNPGSSYSADPVRYSSGEILLEQEDMSFTSFGLQWGHTRSYGNMITDPATGRNGNSWFVKEWPRLVPVDPDLAQPNQPATIALVWVINKTLWFDRNESTGRYMARFSVRPKLRYDADGQQWTLWDSEGRVTKFYDFSDSQPEALRGQFKSITDAAGRETAAVYGADGRMQSFVQTAGTEHSGFYYVYNTSGTNAGLLAQVTYKVNGHQVKRAKYNYYGTGQNHGSPGDLRRVTVQKFTAGQWMDLTHAYYRYYTKNDGVGVKHGLRFVLSSLGYQSMVQHGITPETSTNEQLAGFAQHEFRYDQNRAVSNETVNSGTVNYKFQREARGQVRQVQKNEAGQVVSIVHEEPPAEEDYNVWNQKTVEDRPDGNRTVVYTNFAGQVILNVLILMRGMQETTQRWCHYYCYDEVGRTVLEALPSAVASYDENLPGLVMLKESSGLLRIQEYYSSGDNGGAPGRLRFEAVQKGSASTPIKVNEWTYVARTLGDNTLYSMAEEIVYRGSSNGGSEPATTSYGYTWQNFQVLEQVTTWPVVPVEQNGSGVPDALIEAYDPYNRLTWRKNERGYITGFSYNPANDTLVQQVEDVGGGAPWPVLPGIHLNLVTDYTVDDEGRIIQKLGPVHEIDLNGTAVQIRRAGWTIYQDEVSQQWQGVGYQKVADGSYTLINPVSLRVYDQAMRLQDELQAVRVNTDGPLVATDSFPQSSWVRWTRNLYEGFADLSAQRVYFAIPAEGEGERNLNYNQSDYGYDIFHRKVRERSSGGTITRYVHHPLDWVLQKWVGTDDTGANDVNPSGGGAEGNNMVIVDRYQYDSGKAGGDGTLTKLTQYVNATDTRVTTYRYDFRSRRTSTDGEIDFWEGYTLDNLDRVKRIDQRNTTSSGKLVRRAETNFDSRGRAYQQLQYGVDPETGNVSTPLRENSWFHGGGHTIKLQKMGSRAFTKIAYDAANRPIATYLCCDADETAYEEAGSVADDIVMEQREVIYDAASNSLLRVLRERFHDAVGTGPLTSPSGIQPKARVSYLSSWPDALGRNHVLANYGTNSGVAINRPPAPPAPSDIVLIATTVYNERAEVVQLIDSNQVTTCQIFDDKGRVITTIENYIPSAPNSAIFSTPPLVNRTMEFRFNGDDKLVELITHNAETGEQSTRWEYGTTLNDSALASFNLLRKKTCADGGTIQYGYNRLEQLSVLADQNGTIREFGYDKLNNLNEDRAVGLGHGVDGRVRRINRSYEVRGLLQRVTSMSAPDSDSSEVVNESYMAYDEFEQIAENAQAHDGAVSSSTPKVIYGYANGDDNTVRRTSVSYPNGRAISLGYGTKGSPDDLFGRIIEINEVHQNYAHYTWLGLSTAVVVKYLEPSYELTFIKRFGEAEDDGGDPYTGIDRFGRIADVRWINSNSSDLERVKYAFDRAGNRIRRVEAVELGGGFDEQYSYDGLYQLKDRRRSVMENNDITSMAPMQEEGFTFDITGNWSQYVEKVNGSVVLAQTRGHTATNEIHSITNAIGGNVVATGYDQVGNIVKIPKVGAWETEQALTWDAWGRLVKVEEGSNLVGAYQYDGISRRTLKESIVEGVTQTRHFYYSDMWQVLEERIGPNPQTAPAERQFIWGIRYIDDLILRDQWFVGEVDPLRLYAFHDQWHITGVSDRNGSVKERYTYSAFGKSEVLSSDFTLRPASLYGWETRYGAYHWDEESDLYQVRYRYLHPTLGRWLTGDPLNTPYFASSLAADAGLSSSLIQYASIERLYVYAANSAVNGVDVTGLWSPDAHDALFDHAFGDQLNEGCLDKLKAAGRTFDKLTQLPGQAHLHSQREPCESPEHALKRRDKFIKNRSARAREAAKQGNCDAALAALAQAAHPIQDSTSPVHMHNGKPTMWSICSPLSWRGHSPNEHRGLETKDDITKEDYEYEDKALRKLYNDTLKGTACYCKCKKK